MSLSDDPAFEESRWAKEPNWNYAHRVYSNGVLACRPGDRRRYTDVPDADEFDRRCQLCASIVGKSTL